MKITFDLIGEEKVFEILDNLVDTQELERAMAKAAIFIEGEAKKRAPRDTSNLANSITSKVETTGGEVVGTVFTPLYYAPYVEYGTGLFAEDGNGRQDVPWRYQDDKGEWHTTSGQHPQPFMRPALDENREQVIQILKEGVIND